MFFSKLFLLLSASVLIGSYMGEGRMLMNKPLEARERTEDKQQRNRPPSLPSPRSRRSSTCDNGPASTLSEEEKKEALDEHNRLRSELQNSGDEAEMTWDDELAALAQNLSNTCDFNHAMLHTCDGKGIGQNMAVVMPDMDVSPQHYIGFWFAEGQAYDFNTGVCTPTNNIHTCGHYTQVIWHKSSKLGCAKTSCAKVTGTGGATDPSGQLFICNYYPAGNVVGRMPYTEDTPCGQCGNLGYANNKFSCNNNLCNPCEGDDCECIQDIGGDGSAVNTNTCTCDSCSEGYCGKLCNYQDSNPQCDLYYQYGYCSNPAYTPFFTADCPCTCLQDAAFRAMTDL